MKTKVIIGDEEIAHFYINGNFLEIYVYALFWDLVGNETFENNIKYFIDLYLRKKTPHIKYQTIVWLNVQ